MRIGEYALKLDRAEKTVRTGGTDFGPHPYRLIVEDRITGIIVMHVRGHKRWGGYGQTQQYEPARFYVFKVLRKRDADMPGYLICEQLASFAGAARGGATHGG